MKIRVFNGDKYCAAELYGGPRDGEIVWVPFIDGQPATTVEQEHRWNFDKKHGHPMLVSYPLYELSLEEPTQMTRDSTLDIKLDRESPVYIYVKDTGLEPGEPRFDDPQTDLPEYQ